MITTRILLRRLAAKRHMFLILFTGLLIAIVRVSLTSFNDGLARSFLEQASQQACRFPRLLVDDPLMREYFQEEMPLQCSQEKNWIHVDNGVFYIDYSAVTRHGSVDCELWYIKHRDNSDYSESHVKDMRNGTAITHSMFRVNCKAADGSVYTNLHAAVPLPTVPRKISEPHTRNDQQAGQRRQLNVMMYLFDSVSRMHFMRKLPKFYKFLMEKMRGYPLEGYNIVGDSTTAAMIPMTTGMFQTELPEARKRFENSTLLDHWPWIFKAYKERGYVTTYVEEQADTNVFHIRFKGFKEPPADHYLRPLLLAYENHKFEQEKYCLGDTPISFSWLEFFRQLQITHRPLDLPHFSILFTSEMSHDHYNFVQALDEHLVNRFSSLLDGGYLDDTLLFVMSDHGARHAIARKTQSGKWEERLPFLFIRPPPGFCQTYPNSCENLRANRQSLITVFDLHTTLHHILNLENFPDGGTGNLSERSISVFKKIPDERTCAHAHISAHFCSCLEWTKINQPSGDQKVLNGARYVVDKFNAQINKEVAGTCANLTVEKIKSANQLQPNEKLLAWQKSDYDNLIPSFSENQNAAAAVIYQIHFVTQPGAGEWEVSVTYFADLDRYAMSSDSISRINKYGDHARCVIDDYPHLRTFCYCVRDKV